jgi:hypothetical protein
MDWEYVINSVGLTKYSTKEIEGFVDWDFINANELVGQVKDIDVDLLYKGSKSDLLVCLGRTWSQRKDLLTCGQTFAGPRASILKGFNGAI